MRRSRAARASSIASSASTTRTAAGASFWNPPPANPGGPENLFAFSVYDRGAMALQVLREEIGNADFREILETWAQDNQFGNASTEDLYDLIEVVTGESPARLLRRVALRAGQAGVFDLPRGLVLPRAPEPLELLDVPPRALRVKAPAKGDRRVVQLGLARIHQGDQLCLHRFGQVGLAGLDGGSNLAEVVVIAQDPLTDHGPDRPAA